MYTYQKIGDNALGMLAAGANKTDILFYLAKETEKLLGSVVSILLLDEQGLLRNGASPRLPQDYLRAIDGIKPDPKVGTCAAAAATGQMVITPDFRADTKWAELKHLPLAIGYAGAWSIPIKNKNSVVLGTFGVYLKNIRQPSPQEIQATEALAEVAAKVLSPGGLDQ